MADNMLIDAKHDTISRDSPLPDVSNNWQGDLSPEFELLAKQGERLGSRSGQILILEANRRLRNFRVRILSQEGYSVTSVSSLEEAAEAANRQFYELIIIVVEKPELLNMLFPRFPPDTSVLIISTEDAVRKTAEWPAPGMHSFLVQPFSMKRFKDTVAHTIKRARSVKETLRNKILTDLAHTNRLLATEAEIEKFFKLVVEISGAVTGADYVSLVIEDEETEKFVIKAQRGSFKSAWERICQQLIKIGEPILLDEATQNHPHLYRLMTEAGISAVLHIPLVIKGTVIGAINHIKEAKKAQFAHNDLSFTSILGWWSSIVLENARLFDSLQRQHLYIDKLLHEICAAQENERKRLAVEIHDGIAQWMVAASYDIDSCNILISELRFAELASELAKIKTTLQRSIKELRRTIANLRPLPLEKAGLVAAIQQATEALSEEGIRCHTKVDGRLPKLTRAEENTTYWIVQEVLTNIRKHSKASEASIRMQFRDGTVSIEISDNGQGFNPNEVINSEIPLEHVGLIGMKERAELLGGYLNISSSPGRGTLICFAFPVTSRVTME